MATVEHIKPLSRGGTDDWHNLAMACLRCNGMRGTSDAYGFYHSRQWTWHV
jgi:5-methylcytosine-specific restriction endonuclease McrA